MGCDIHLHVEIKLNGKWEHWNHPYIVRNYSLFAKMAGVRAYCNEVEPISKPRGLPGDISVVTKFDADCWKNDGHSHSWLNAVEAGEVQEWFEKRFKNECQHPPLFGYVFGNDVHTIVKHPGDCEDLVAKGFSDVRIVFWFDN